MSFDFEGTHPERSNSFADRYKAIDLLNADSFYMTNPFRTFDIFQSIQSIGEARVNYSTSSLVPTPTLMPQRFIAGGNMSTIFPYGPRNMSEEKRIADARHNMSAFFESIGVPETSVYILHPDRDYSTPLTPVNVDVQPVFNDTIWPARLDTAGDFIYTRDPKKVLAVRPADCPVMIASADTPEGKLYMMVHYAWQGVARGYIQQTAALFDSLCVAPDSLEIYLSPGAQAENFPYTDYPMNPLEEFPGTEGLFTDVICTPTNNNAPLWNFRIDTPKFVYDQILHVLNVKPSQIFIDLSDTGALNSGYSSHTRSSQLKKQGESNTRDIVTAVFSTDMRYNRT